MRQSHLTFHQNNDTVWDSHDPGRKQGDEGSGVQGGQLLVAHKHDYYSAVVYALMEHTTHTSGCLY
jgi:hypothetical protein